MQSKAGYKKDWMEKAHRLPRLERKEIQLGAKERSVECCSCNVHWQANNACSFG